MSVRDADHVRREGIRVPPPAYPLAAVVAGAALARAVPWGPAPGPGIRVAGVALAVAGLAWMTWAIVAQRRGGTDPNPWAKTTDLVTSGPYRFGRNPIYLADLAVQGGVGLATGWWWTLLLLPATWAALRFLVIAREERFLQQIFGVAYADYCRHVRRWV